MEWNCTPIIRDSFCSGTHTFSIQHSTKLLWWSKPALFIKLRHNGRDGVSNHQPHECLLNCLFRGRSKKTSKLRVTGFCAGNSPMTGEFPAQMASNAENVSIWWVIMCNCYSLLYYCLGFQSLSGRRFGLRHFESIWNLDSGLKLFIQQQNTWQYTKEMKSYVEQLLHYMVWHRCIKHSSKHSFSLWLRHVRRLPLRLKINRLHGSHHKSKGQGFKDMLSYLVLV